MDTNKIQGQKNFDANFTNYRELIPAQFQFVLIREIRVNSVSYPFLSASICG